MDALIRRTAGDPSVAIGLIDGPVVVEHPDLTGEHIRVIDRLHSGTCARRAHPACIHGTFIAGILLARKGADAPAICPDCTLYVHTIFPDDTSDRRAPGATPRDLSAAILNCIAAGVRVINISAAVYEPRTEHERLLTDALDRAAQRGVIVVVASGNDGAIGSTALTAHRWVIPVVGHDRDGRPMSRSNYGKSIGERGLAGPGDRVTSLGTQGPSLTLSGTSVAAPFVTGTIALMCSEFPRASASAIKTAVTRSPRRRSVVPPLLDASAAYDSMRSAYV